MRIGYYAHHHGSGHCRQADKLAALLPPHLQHQLIVFTSFPDDRYHFTTIKEAQIVRLSNEDELAEDVLVGRAGQYWQPSSLHYSPVGNKDIRMRSWQLLDTIKQRQIDLMIIDVSVEVAMLCRVASVPYLYVRLPGERDDMPHIGAFTGALGILAPYPKALEAAATPNWVRQKTLYLDFLASKAFNSLSPAEFLSYLASLAPSNVPFFDKSAQPLIVTVIKGYGGHKAIDDKLATLRDALPSAFIISLGPIDDYPRQFVDIATEVEEVTPFIVHSDLLVMAPGLNSIAQVYQWQTPVVVLPDERPHREQEVMAEALITQGRALSWEQFMAQTVNENHLSKFTKVATTPQDVHNDQPLAAQNFIDSIVAYDTVKSWFQEWLLPQLAISIES